MLKDFWPRSNLCQMSGGMSALLQQGKGFPRAAGEGSAITAIKTSFSAVESVGTLAFG